MQSLFQQVTSSQILYLLLAFALLVTFAYLAILPIAKRLRAELSQYLSLLSDRGKDAREARKARMDEMVREFQKHHLLKLLHDTNYGLFHRALESVTSSAKSLHVEITRCIQAVTSSSEPVQKLVKNLPSLRPMEIRELPNSEGAQVSFADLRVARTVLLVLSILVLIVIFVNTGMLSQIIRDLGFIPLTLSLGNLPLYVLLALALTVFEAGIGIGYDLSRSRMFRARGGDEQKINIWSGVLIVLAIIIACMEGFFYSQVAPSKDSLFEFPFIGYQMKQEHLFFLWGFALVAGLFVLGSKWWHAFDVVRRGNSFTVMQKEIHELSKKQALQAEVHERTATTLAGAEKSAQAVCELFDTANSRTMAAKEEIGKYVVTLTGNDAPYWARVTEEELTPGDIQHLSNQAGVGVCLILGGSIAHWSAGYRVLGSLSDSLAGIAGMIALGLVIIFLGSGVLIRGDEKVVGGSGSERVLVSFSLLGRMFGIGLLALTTSAYIAILVRMRFSWMVAVLWIISLLLGLLLAATAYYFYPRVNVSRIWLRSVWNLMASVCENLFRFIVKLVLLLTVVVEYVGLLFSAPVYQLLGRPMP